MKKVLLFLLTIMLGLASWQVSAQQIVEIGTGSSTTYYGPFNSLWGYSFVEQIYTAEEIDMTGTITSISFNNSSSGQTNNITVYMKLVTRSSFSSSTDYETVTAADIVYTGSHNFAQGWSEITLDAPFDYDGASNLLIAVHEYTSGYTTQNFYYTSTTDNKLISFHSDSADPDPYNLGSYSGNKYTQTYRNNIRLAIMPSGSTCYTPLSPAVSGVSAYEATLSWTPRENQTAWEVFCGSGITDLDQVSWTPVTDTFYTFTNLAPATNYTAYVRTVCGTEVSNARQVAFTTEATCASVPSNVTVNGITATTVDVNWTADANDNAWEVVVVPSNMAPETGTPEATSSHPYTVTNLQDNTQYKVYVRTDCGGGDHSYWSDPATFTTLPFCSAPLNVNVSQITANSALVSWQPAVYGATSYSVGYTLASEDIWTDVQVDGTQFMLSNLEPDSTYIVRVYSNCPIGTGDTINKTFTTKHCLVGGDIAIGEGTTTNYYIPVNNYYNYTYSQQIFLASEMSGPTTINSVSFYYSYSTPSTDKTNVTIYLGHTTKNEFSGTSDFIQPTGLQQVYTGNLNCQQGWNTFTFTTPFQYNGTDNLVLAVDDNSGDYNGSSYTFYVHSTGNSYRSVYYYSDGTNPDPNNPTSGSPTSSRSTNRNNVIFGGDCDNDVTCVRPNVYVTETGTYSVTLDWAPGYSENSWEIEYSADNVTWTSAGTTSLHPYDVSGLNSDTRYYFRVRSNCGSDVSEWSGANARTECGPITQLPYFNNFDEVITDNGTAFITCWSRYTTNPERVVRCYGSATHSGSYALDFNYSPSCTTAAVTPMLDPSIPLNTVMLDFWAYSGLGQGWMEVGTMSDPNDFTTYEFYDTVRLTTANAWENLIIDFSNYTGTNQYIAFLEINGTTTSYIFDDFTIAYATNCLHPTNLAVDALTNTTVTLSWLEAGSATSWEIEYGPVGFTPGTGTTVSAGTNPFTVDNLTPATTYDFYVSANCGSELSTPFGPVQATPGQYTFGVTGSDTLTTCGVILYDDGGANGDYSNSSDFTLVIYPENPSAVLAILGTSSTESCCDYLRVYDGVGTSGQQLAEYKGENLTVNAMSQSGPLTLVFHSDGSVIKSGFAINVVCVTCYPPTNITASNPTLDGATVTWSGNGDSYVLFLNGDMTTGYDASDTTYTFTGLNPSSSYSVQVAAICNGDTSMLSSAGTFSTACGAITITSDNPWTEDFESYAGSGVQQFICWERPVTEVVDNGTAPFVYCNYGQAAHSGANTAEMKGSVNMLALPEFTNNLSELRVSFWATGYSYSNTNVEVGYITDLTDPTTFVPVFANAGVPGARGGSGGGNGNYMGPFSFSNVSVSGARIALRYTGPGSSSGWNVDDFVVEIAPDCESPVKSSVTATNIGGHVATITWVDNDPSHTAWTVYYKETAGNDWSTAAANDTTIQLTGLDPLTQYDVYVITNCGTPETNPDATHTIHFTTTVACPAPSGLTLASVSTDEATITWNGTASSYNVEYGETGFTPGTGTIDVALTESYTLTNLDPSTNYTIYVNSDCTDNNDSLSSTVSFSFTTTQVPAALPYTADFTVTNEWLLNNGTCSNYWMVGAVDSVPSLFVTNNGTTPNYNLSSTSIVTAEKLLAVGDNASVVISFDVKVGGESSWDYLKVFFAPAESSYPAATSAPDFASYSYTTYAVNFQDYLSQTGSSSYPYKLNLTQGNTLHVTVEMPNPYDNPTITSNAKLVFMWKNDASGGTQPPATISNVSVIVNSCPMPSNLAVDNITSSSADVTWTAGDSETEWEVEYGTHGFDHGAGTVDPVYTTPSLTLNNLVSGTVYDVYVRAVCNAGDSSSWVGPVMVSPGSYNMPVSGNNSITTCDLTIYDDGGAANNYSANCESYLTIYPESTSSLISLQGTLSTESCCDYLRIYDGVGTSGTMFGEYKGTNITIPELVSTTGPITLHFHSDGSVYYSGFALTVSCASNTCPAPTNLTVSNIGTTTADVAWTPTGTESAWVLEYKESTASTWTEIPVTTPSYQFTTLSVLTAYNVRVKADCGAGDESMYVNTTFNTNGCAVSDQCTYTFNLVDSYGDGWNNGSLDVQQNGVTVANLTMTSGSSATETVTLCDNMSTSLVWNTGSYDSEVSFTVMGPDGSEVYNASSVSSGTLTTFTTDCSGSGPVITDPTVATTAATGIGQATATLNGTITNPDGVTITAKGFEWKATAGGTYAPVTVTGNNLTYNLTGLTANTGYTYKAFITFNGTTVYGNEMSFTTLPDDVQPCNVPAGLTAGTITHESIAITWNNDANVNSWNIQYRPVGGTLASATSTTNSYTITGLTPETEYQIQVQADCGNGNVSDWSAAITATTTTGIENHLLNSISLYPNPAKEYIDVRVDEFNVTSMEVYDVYGKLINNVSVIDNPTRINVSNLAAGMYFVRVTTEQGVATKSFVKK
jgi:hypothetical protein